MEPTGDEVSTFSHSLITGWTLTITREPGQSDLHDQPATYVGSVYHGVTARCRLVVTTIGGPARAEAELKRRFEEWVHEYVARDHSGDTVLGDL